MGNIHARIIDEKYGLKELNNVMAIRILSNKYKLLVMEDYAPMIGRVEGSVVVINDEKEHLFDNIKAYYKIQKNQFTLIIDRDAEEMAKKDSNS